MELQSRVQNSTVQWVFSRAVVRPQQWIMAGGQLNITDMSHAVDNSPCSFFSPSIPLSLCPLFFSHSFNLAPCVFLVQWSPGVSMETRFI